MVSNWQQKTNNDNSRIHAAKAFVLRLKADGASHHHLAKQDSEAVASVGRSSLLDTASLTYVVAETQILLIAV